LPKALTTALSGMANLTHVTLIFIVSLNEASAESLDLDIVQKINETLRVLLLDLKSLKSLKIVCPAGQENTYRKHWMELTHSLKDLKVIVTCA